MRTYYRGPDAFISDTHFVWQTATTSRTFAIRDLRGVGLVHSTAAGGRPTSVLVIASIGLGALAAVSWALVDHNVGYAMGFLALITLAVGVQHRVTKQWQIRAVCQGVETTLYANADPRVFNQVARALRRALEDRPKARSRPGLVAA